MGGQLDGNFLPGSVSHKFFSIVTLIICFVVNKFFSLSTVGPGGQETSIDCCTAGAQQQRRANAGSGTLSAHVGS